MSLFKRSQACQVCGSLKRWLPTKPGSVNIITPDVLATIILKCYGSCGKFVCHDCAKKSEGTPYFLSCPGCGGNLAQPMK